MHSFQAQRKLWMPYAITLTGVAGTEREGVIRPYTHFRGEEFFAIDTTKHPGLGTIIEQVRVGARIQLPVPVPTWVFSEWHPPEERPWRMHAAKLIGTPFETEAVRQEAARLGLATSAEKMTWTTAQACVDIFFRVRFLESCTWQAALWGWGLS